MNDVPHHKVVEMSSWASLAIPIPKRQNGPRDVMSTDRDLNADSFPRSMMNNEQTARVGSTFNR